jgi:CheY-like chemotaxis protein
MEVRGMTDARQLRILIVEDEMMIALDLEQLLTEFGYDVCGMARTAGEAIEKATLLRPDFIVTDIQLAQGSNGLDAAREMQSRFNIPSFILSSQVDLVPAQSMPCANLGVLAKPFSPAHLRSALVKAEQSCQFRAA